MVICACAMARSPCPPPSTVRQASEIVTARQSPQKGDGGRRSANEAGRATSIGGDPKRGDRRRLSDEGSAYGRLTGRARAAGIGPAGILVKVLDQKVDEAAHLRRKMMAVRVDRVDGVLGLQKFGQDRNETTRFDLVDEQKARRPREPLAVHRRQPQRVVAAGLQISP